MSAYSAMGLGSHSAAENGEMASRESHEGDSVCLTRRRKVASALVNQPEEVAKLIPCVEFRVTFSVDQGILMIPENSKPRS